MATESTAIEQWMTKSPHSIGAEQVLGKAQDMMREIRCHHLPVRRGGSLVGVLSQSDIRLLGRQDNLDEIEVEEAMSEDIVQVAPGTSVLEVARQMAEKHVSSVLIVGKKEELLGIFTWVDLAKFVAKAGVKS